MDENDNMIHMDPFSWNAAIGYRRLNVPNEQKAIWENPWTKESSALTLWLDTPGFECVVDFLRGRWDADAKALASTMKT